MNGICCRPVRAFVCTMLMFAGTGWAHAGGHTLGTIAALQVSRQGTFALLQMSAVPTASPACQQTGTWHFTVPLTTEAEKRIYALLVAEKLSQQQVMAIGSGACLENASVESIDAVQLR